MASLMTFLQVTNSVLRALNSAPVADADFADPSGLANAREVIAAKAAVLEAHQEMQNKRPDSFWVTEADFQGAGAAGPTYSDGQVLSTNFFSPDETQFVGTGTNWVFMFLTFHANGVPPIMEVRLENFSGPGDNSPWRRVTRVLAPIIMFSKQMPEPYGSGSSGPYDYTVRVVKWALPSNMVDPVKLYYEGRDKKLGGVHRRDLRYVSPETFLEHEKEDLYVSDPNGEAMPEEWTILHDSGDRILSVRPEPTSPIRLTLRYVRSPTIPSLASDEFDVPEDEMPRLLNRAKHRALMADGRAEQAMFYVDREDEAQGDAFTKQMERVKVSRLVPDTQDFRSHYRESSWLDKYNARRNSRLNPRG